MALKSYIVDDGNMDVLLVWAERSSSALKMAWDDYGPPRKDHWGNPTGKTYTADVTRITLPDVTPPATAGFETREDVLEKAAEFLGSKTDGCP